MQFKCIFTAAAVRLYVHILCECICAKRVGGELLILFLSFSALASAADFWRPHLHAPRRGFKCIRKRPREAPAAAAAYPPSHTPTHAKGQSGIELVARDDFVKDWESTYLWQRARGDARWRCLHRRKSASLWNWKLVCVNKVFLCKYMCTRAGEGCDKGRREHYILLSTTSKSILLKLVLKAHVSLTYFLHSHSHKGQIISLLVMRFSNKPWSKTFCSIIIHNYTGYSVVKNQSQ